MFSLQISQRWILGPELCDMWTSSDVLCCTASILHLVAIATDRYIYVVTPDESRAQQIYFMEYRMVSGESGMET